MLNPPIDPLESPRYALAGRVVTMNSQFDVIDRGRVHVDAGRIVAVQSEATPVPPSMTGAPVVATGGTIYPGLIELHNHLSYNALPLWQLTEHFGNRGIWATRPEYRQLVSRPAGVLGRTDGLVQSVVRYVEAKCLVSGVTTTQGVSLASNAGIRRFYRGIVRNVENTDDPELKEAATRIDDVTAADAAKFLARLQREDSLLLLHLSEGVDDTARRHFLHLQTANGQWAITNTLGGIHCCGLRDEDYATLAENNGSMVWSPFSNLLLYGKTSDFERARREGILMTLGPDWSPTGSKNLLAEMKVARILCRAVAHGFTSKEIVAMATINAARLLKWEQALGSIEAGKRADLVVVDDRQGDVYDHLIDARETSVMLVVVNGVPRYGAPSLMARFTDEVETLRVGNATRAVDFRQATGDPLVGALSLAEATERLTDGLARLPDLGETAPELMGARPLAESGSDERWFLELDHAPLDGSTVRLEPPLGPGRSLADAAAWIAEDATPLIPLELDPLTVVDDRGFAKRIATQPNLPVDVKEELPRLYGK